MIERREHAAQRRGGYSGSIQILAPEVVERIAAGEVIERPVSVVRELLDNALDAGAHEIRIDVRGGGLRSIRVTDDGAGIPADQVELAFRHHATSKIRDAADLRDVSTLGFRGEALPSIAAVSELSLATATEESPIAVRVELRYGEQAVRGYASRTHGTTVTVRNLFGNVPARLRFLANPRTESSLISQLVRRYALAHSDVRLCLTFDGHPSLRTSGLGPPHVLGEALGPDVARAMVPLGPVTAGEVEISGFITSRHITRGSRQHLTLIVDRRCVHSRTLASAVEHGYRALLPRGRHPIAVLILSPPREDVDVNIHPSKAEVRLRDETAIGAELSVLVRDALGRNVDTPPDESFALGPAQFELPRMVAESRSELGVATGQRLRAMHVVGQVHGSLILVEDATGLYLVDQHRAHERAIYELLERQHAEGRAGQFLLEPIQIELSPIQAARLETRLPELASLGFACEWFGGRSFLVRGVPAIPETSDLPGAVEDLLDLATIDDSDWQHRLLTSIACRTATRRGRSLTIVQCRELIHLLADSASPAVCPHGSPIILHFTDRFLERQFDW